jgi:PKD repeat protein
VIDVSSVLRTGLTLVTAAIILIALIGPPAVAVSVPAQGTASAASHPDGAAAASVAVTQVGGVELRFVPVGDPPSVNGTATFRIVAEGVTQDITAARITVETSDPGVLAVTGGSTQFVVPRENPFVEPPTSAEFLAFDEGDVPNTVTIGTVTVEGRAPGSAQLQFTRSQMRTYPLETTEDYLVTPQNVTVTVAGGAGNVSIPPLVGDRPPADLDGDGRYEDTDGNGQFSILDVATLLEAYDGPIVERNAVAFDFSADGRISILDVAVLLDELQAAG